MDRGWTKDSLAPESPAAHSRTSSSSVVSETVPLLSSDGSFDSYNTRSRARTSVPAVAGFENMFGFGFRLSKPPRFQTVWRFVKFFGAIMACLVAFNFVLFITWEKLKQFGWIRDKGWLPGYFNDLDGLPVTKGELRRCVHPAHWTSHFVNETSITDRDALYYPYVSETSFNLPLSSDNIFLLARGSLSPGSVRFISADNLPSNDSIRVVVKGFYETGDTFRQTKVCRLGARDGRRAGVAISARRFRGRWTIDAQVMFSVAVYIPSGSHVDSFSSVLPRFEHDFGDLSEDGGISFGFLDVRSADAHIHAESIRADIASFRTTQAPISGRFNTSSSLRFSTTDAEVQATVDMWNIFPKPTELNVQTSHGPIDLDVNMHSPLLSSPSLKPQNAPDPDSAFRISAKTSYSRLNLHTRTQPPNSYLSLDASTSGAPASVWLHPAYEGEIEVRSDVVRPTVHVGDLGLDEDDDHEGEGTSNDNDDNGNESDNDTAGEGADSAEPSPRLGWRRIVDLPVQEEHRIRGSVRWVRDAGVDGDQGRGGGRVMVRSSDAPAVLYL